MSIKTEVIVARLFDGAQLVHSIALPQAQERLTVNELVPASLQGLDFDLPEQAPKSLWIQVHWGSVDYIPLDEWMADQYMLEYRSPDRPDLNGVWGPFETRSQVGEFAVALGEYRSAWVAVKLRDPNSYTFPETT